jgi:DNA invertase Pin-like site-specific DNA recombinase
VEKYVSYLRCSTRGQEISGLGLDSQRAMVANYVKTHPGRILAEYEEVESGRNNLRPKLAACLSHARKARARVLVAKLDRLSRDAGFLLRIKAGQVPITFCDLPEATDLVIGVMAVVAQDEACRISARTSAALQALKDRGVALGSARIGHWEGREHLRLAGAKKGVEQSAKVRRRRSEEYLAEFESMFTEMSKQGLSQEEIARRLNEEGLTQQSGSEWTQKAVSRAFAILARQQERSAS